MNVYLIRHGAAEGAESGVEDSRRPLTVDGKAALSASLPGIEKLVGELDYILTSPYLRAAQTAEMIAEHFGAEEFVEELPALAPDGNEKKVCGELNKLIGKDKIAVVGHMPLLGKIAQYIVKGMSEPLDFSKGAIAYIYISQFPEENSGELKWLKTANDLKNA